jgi:hypothetical protein
LPKFGPIDTVARMRRVFCVSTRWDVRGGEINEGRRSPLGFGLPADDSIIALRALP